MFDRTIESDPRPKFSRRNFEATLSYLFRAAHQPCDDREPRRGKAAVEKHRPELVQALIRLRHARQRRVFSHDVTRFFEEPTQRRVTLFGIFPFPPTIVAIERAQVARRVGLWDDRRPVGLPTLFQLAQLVQLGPIVLLHLRQLGECPRLPACPADFTRRRQRRLLPVARPACRELPAGSCRHRGSR